MKKIFLSLTALLFALMITFALIACGAPNNGINTENPDRTETPAEPDPPAAEPPKPADPIVPIDPPPTPTLTPNIVYIRAAVSALNVRSSPTTSSASLGKIEKGDMVILKGKKDGWYITEYKNKLAFISAGPSYTELKELAPSDDERIETVIQEGYKLLGFPYIYGATRLHDGKGNLIKGFDPTKYDCSSLMQYIFYYGAKVNLNMTTRTQISQGKHIERSNLQRGDLMFFTNASRYYNTGLERVGHVALYLGENYILHTASDYAVIEEISAQRWKYYQETRRMI